MSFDYIALDTSALRTEGWPDVSADLESLLRLAKTSKSIICVPRTVMLELEDYLRTVHQERAARARTALGKIERVARNPDVLKQLQIPDVESQLSDSLMEADRVIGKWQIEIVPVTSRPVEHFVAMAARKEAPFQKDGVGFKDAVIFFSLIDYLSGKRGRRSGGRVVLGLIAPDSDFSHDSLAKVAENAGIELSIIKSVQEMNERLTGQLEDTAKALYAEDRAQALVALEQIRPEIERILNADLEIPLSELYSVGISDSLQVKGIDLLSLNSVRTSFNLLLGLPVATKIAADINIAIRLSVTRRVSTEQSPLRVGAQWSSSLDLIAHMAASKIERTDEVVSKVAKLEAQGIKTSSGYKDLVNLSVRLPKRGAFSGE